VSGLFILTLNLIGHNCNFCKVQTNLLFDFCVVKTINLFGEIGWDVTLQSVIADMNGYVGDSLTINISGPGGYVDEAFAIYGYLLNWKKENKAKITFNIIGTCASCSSFIPMVGDEIVVNSGSRMMIHLASAFGGGNSEELRKMANDLESYSNQIADIYLKSNKKGKTIDEIKNWMNAETYFNAQELMDYGFATKFEDVRAIAKIKNNENQINMSKLIDTIMAKVQIMLAPKNEITPLNIEGSLEDGTPVLITPVDESLGVPVAGDMVSPALPEFTIVVIGGEKYQIQSDEAGLILSVVEVMEEELMSAQKVKEIVDELSAKFESDLAALKNEIEAINNEKKNLTDALVAKDAEIVNLKQVKTPAIGKKTKETEPKNLSVKERALKSIESIK